MKYRIAMWTGVGLLVAAWWALYALAVPITPAEPIAYNLARLTQPIVLVGSHFHFGVYFYWVLVANAGTYGLLGVIVEFLRRPLNPSS